MVIIKIFYQLIFPTIIIFLSMPDLHFDNILFTQIVYNNICPFLLSGLSLYIIIACSIDNRS